MLSVLVDPLAVATQHLIVLILTRREEQDIETGN